MERQHRVMLVSGIISAVLGLLAGFWGGRLAAVPPLAAPAVMRAEHFQLVDPAGKVRGRLGVDPLGVARLVLLGGDPTGPRVRLAAYPQGNATLELGDDQGQSAVEIQATPQGSRNISFYSAGKLCLELAVQPNGAPAVGLYDQGNRLITLGVTPQGDAQLLFYGASHKTALEAISKKNGDRSLNIMGKDGTPRLVLGLKNDRKAALGLFDRRGKTRVALMDEPSLIFLRQGRLVRILP